MVDVYTLHVTCSRTKFEELNMEKSSTGNAFLTLSNYLKKPLLLLLHHHHHHHHVIIITICITVTKTLSVL